MSDPGSLIADPYARPPRPQTSPLALSSLAFSVLGFLCLWGVGGLLGVAFGVMARREIEDSEGRKHGSGLATLGIALGTLNVVACVVALGVAISLLARPKPVTRPSVPPPPAPTAAASPSPRATASARTAQADLQSRDSGIIVTRVGKIDLVDLGPDVRGFSDELDRQRAIAGREHKQLMLWTVQSDCQPCNGVAAALPEPSMQAALEQVRLVRVNPEYFGLELEQFNIPTDKIPGFALLGPDNHPIDYVHGGEWDADVADNIAPVLGKFVRRTYKQRREPWRGGARSDETAL